MISTSIYDMTYLFILAHATKLVIFRHSHLCITTTKGGGFKVYIKFHNIKLLHNNK